MAKIKKGDTVEVVSGNDRDLQGGVQRVLTKSDRVVVAGINKVKKHQRPMRAGRTQVQPGIIEFEAPIHVSNVMLVCPSKKTPTRIGKEILSDGSRARVSKKSGEMLND